MVRCIRKGVPVAGIPEPVKKNDTICHLNWKIFGQAGIDTALAPEGTSFYNRYLPLVEQYKTELILCLVLAIFILFGLFSALYFLIRSRALQKDLKTSHEKIALSLFNQKQLFDTLSLFLRSESEEKAVEATLRKILQEF